MKSYTIKVFYDSLFPKKSLEFKTFKKIAIEFFKQVVCVLIRNKKIIVKVANISKGLLRRSYVNSSKHIKNLLIKTEGTVKYNIEENCVKFY